MLVFARHCLQIEEMVEVPVVLELASDLLDRRCPIFRCVRGSSAPALSPCRELVVLLLAIAMFGFSLRFLAACVCSLAHCPPSFPPPSCTACPLCLQGRHLRVCQPEW